MPTESHGSITHLLGTLKAGDLAAAQPLWERTSSDSCGSPARSSGPDTAAAPTPTRRMPPSASSTASATARPAAASPNWTTATICGGCW